MDFSGVCACSQAPMDNKKPSQAQIVDLKLNGEPECGTARAPEPASLQADLDRRAPVLGAFVAQARAFPLFIAMISGHFGKTRARPVSKYRLRAFCAHQNVTRGGVRPRRKCHKQPAVRRSGQISKWGNLSGPAQLRVEVSYRYGFVRVTRRSLRHWRPNDHLDAVNPPSDDARRWKRSRPTLSIAAGRAPG